MMRFRAGGAEVPHEELLRADADLLSRSEWIIDGCGSEDTLWARPPIR
jgi:hypothetical protein